MTNFEKNLPVLKSEFKKHLNDDWSANKPLFMQYVAARYAGMQADVLATALSALVNEQGRISSVLGSISTELAKRKS